MSYSSDVFFKPWVNNIEYSKGWYIDNNQLCYGSALKTNRKFMVLGKEHRCDHISGINVQNQAEKKSGKNNQCHMHFCSCNSNCQSKNGGIKKGSCNQRNNLTCLQLSCGHLDVCRDLTIQVGRRPIYKSFKKFETIFGCQSNIWNNILFSNFFQRGMPFTKENKDFCTPTERERACKAFADILKTHAPDIVWAWNDWDPIMKSIDDNYDSCLKGNGITIDVLEKVNRVYKYTDPINPHIYVPRLYILQDGKCMHNSKIYAVESSKQCTKSLKINDIKTKIKIKTKRGKEKEIKTDLPFLVLKYNDKNGNEHKTLMVFSYHPSFSYFNENDRDSQYLKIIFNDYENIINWNCSPNPNITDFSQNPRLTMIYDNNLNLLNR